MAGELDTRWNAWQALRERAHLELRWGILDGCEGMIVDHDLTRTIWLDTRLLARDRHAVLTHELIHDERGIFYDQTTPDALVAKEERSVENEVTRRLVPPVELAQFLRARVTVGRVESWEVADEFDVPQRVAERAMSMLRHPTGLVSRARGAS